MSGPDRVPYGAWPSPITAERAASASVRLGEVFVAGDEVTWLEQRPEEAGRYVVMRGGPGILPIDLTPAGFSARTRVHEYGGGSYAVAGAGMLFTNDGTRYLTRQDFALGMECFNAAVLELAREPRAYAFDLARAVDSREYFTDEVHLSDAGVEREATLVARFILDHGVLTAR